MTAILITAALTLAGIAFAWLLARALARPATRPGLAEEVALMGDWPRVDDIRNSHAALPTDGAQYDGI